MMNIYILLSLCYLAVVFTNCEAAEGNTPSEKTIVNISEGKLRGIVQKSRNGRDYNAFLGVHYAKKPKRFQIAGPPVAWEGIKHANKFGNVCPQFFFPTTKFIGDEDCLVNNIYTPDLNGKKPVLVFIHGGAFMFGISDGYGAKYFMDHDVVLVTMNYRLGILGFLSTEDDVIQGNFGLKDQVQSLKWIQKNIGRFGGDKDKVVIFGESAGAASVNYHLISRMSKGLFSGAISQSGAALNPWALQRNPLENAKKLAEIFECPLEEGRMGSLELKYCLQNKSTKEIVDSQAKYVKLLSGDPICPFAPSVENVNADAKGESPIFLNDTPYNILTDEKFRDQVSSNVNWIVGITEKEGLLIHAGVILNEKSERGKKIRESLNSDRETVYPVTLAYEHTVPRHYWRSVSDDVHKFYFGDKQIGLKTPEETINLYSDRYFNHGIRNSAKLFAKFGGKVFLYKFTYKGKFSFSEYYGATPGFHAVTHLDDLTYQFNMTFSTQVVPEFDENKEMMQISKDFLELWISFAKKGTPEILSEESSEKWTPVSKDEEEPQWYIIDKERKFSTDPSFTARMKFWDTLPKLREMEREKLENTRTEL